MQLDPFKPGLLILFPHFLFAPSIFTLNICTHTLLVMDSATDKECFRLLDLPAEIRDMIYEHLLFGSAHDTDASQREASLNDGIEIQTNILLTSRQVFREARNTIFRAQMVEITSHGGKLEEMRRRAVMEDGIPLYHPKYKHFCLLEHISKLCLLHSPHSSSLWLKCKL